MHPILQADYVGYVKDYQMRPDLTGEHVFVVRKEKLLVYPKGKPDESKLFNVFYIPTILLLVPLFLVLKLIHKSLPLQLERFIRSKLVWLLRIEVEERVDEQKHYREGYNGVEEENIPEVMASARRAGLDIVLYGYNANDPEQKKGAEEFARKYQIKHVFPEMNERLAQFIKSEVNIANSIAIHYTPGQYRYWKSLGFDTGYLESNNVCGWGVNDDPGGRKHALSFKTLNRLKITHVVSSVYPRSDHFLKSSDVYLIYARADKETRADLEMKIPEWTSKFEKAGYHLHYVPAEGFAPGSVLAQKYMAWLKFRLGSLQTLHTDELEADILRIFESSSQTAHEDSFLEYLDLPELPTPCFLHLMIDLSRFDPDTLSVFPLADISARTSGSIDYYIDHLCDHLPGLMRQARKHVNGKYDADLFYSPEAESHPPDKDEIAEAGDDAVLLEKIHQELAGLTSLQQIQVMTTLLRRLADYWKEKHPDLSQELLRVLQQRTATPRLSRLSITSDYRLFLLDYNYIEIKMYPLAKVVFLLFLRYPDGITFKGMSDYRAEIESLYKAVTGRDVNEKIRQSLYDLSDATHTSIAQKTARISAAFRAHLPDDIARYYYITGPNGEPKRIILPRELVVLPNDASFYFKLRE